MTANNAPGPETFDAKEMIRKAAEDAAEDVQLNLAMKKSMSTAAASAILEIGPVAQAIRRIEQSEDVMRMLTRSATSLEPTIIDQIRATSHHEMDLFNLEEEKRERADAKEAEKERRRNLEAQTLENSVGQREALTAMLKTLKTEHDAAAAREAARIQADKARESKDKLGKMFTALGIVITVVIAAATLILTAKAL